jgi:hypothetical protein
MVWNVLSMSTESTVSTNTNRQQTFSMVTSTLYKEPCREEQCSLKSTVREFSVQQWSVNRQTMEAEEATNSYLRTKSATQKRRHS